MSDRYVEVKTVDYRALSFDGYVIARMTWSLCLDCGSMVGDATKHDEWHVRVGVAPP